MNLFKISISSNLNGIKMALTVLTSGTTRSSKYGIFCFQNETKTQDGTDVETNLYRQSVVQNPTLVSGFVLSMKKNKKKYSLNLKFIE